MVAAVKSTNERSLELLQDQQRSRQELARALDVVSTAIQRQATAVESLSAGVGYNTSRVGAVTGEIQKVRKWIEWFSTKSLDDIHFQSTKLSNEQGVEAEGLEPDLTLTRNYARGTTRENKTRTRKRVSGTSYHVTTCT